MNDPYRMSFLQDTGNVIILIIFILIFIFFVWRELICWYYKIDKLVDLLGSIDERLKNIENNSITKPKDDVENLVYKTIVVESGKNPLPEQEVVTDKQSDLSEVQNKVANSNYRSLNINIRKPGIMDKLMEELTKKRHLSDLFGKSPSKDE